MSSHSHFFNFCSEVDDMRLALEVELKQQNMLFDTLLGAAKIPFMEVVTAAKVLSEPDLLPALHPLFSCLYICCGLVFLIQFGHVVFLLVASLVISSWK